MDEEEPRASCRRTVPGPAPTLTLALTESPADEDTVVLLTDSLLYTPIKTVPCARPLARPRPPRVSTGPERGQAHAGHAGLQTGELPSNDPEAGADWSAVRR